MLKTAKPWIYGKEQVVRLSKLQGAMPKLRQMIATWDLDRVYDVRLRHVQLGVKARKLLGENYVPVGALKVRPLSLFLFLFSSSSSCWCFGGYTFVLFLPVH